MKDKTYFPYHLNEYVIIDSCLPKEIGIINNIKDNEISVKLLDSEIVGIFSIKQLSKIRVSNNHFLSFCEEIEHEQFKVKESTKEILFKKRREKVNHVYYDDYTYSNNDNVELSFYYISDLIKILDKNEVNYNKTQLLKTSLV